MNVYNLNSDRKKCIEEIPCKKNDNKRLRVAAYCRISTRDPEQLSSLSFQQEYFENLIKENPEWILAGVYADIGSETQIKGRISFQQMLMDCDKGKIDLVLTKSVFRFARNTLDTLKTVRSLKEKGIGVYFDQEQINTIQQRAEFMVAVISGFAQHESYSKSKDIKWGLEQAFQNPGSKFYQRKCYGYKHDASGKLIIDEEKAYIVRLIYTLFLNGSSLAKISTTLKDMGIPSPRNNPTWGRETIRKILKNEKYTGCVMLQKTFVEDYLTHKQVRNDGQRSMFLIENNHEAIIRDILK